MGTFKSSRDSQAAYSTDNETRKHQTLIFTLTHSLKIYLKSEAETFTISPFVAENDGKTFQLYFSLSSTESVGAIYPLLTIVLGYSVLVNKGM